MRSLPTSKLPSSALTLLVLAGCGVPNPAPDTAAGAEPSRNADGDWSIELSAGDATVRSSGILLQSDDGATLGLRLDAWGRAAARRTVAPTLPEPGGCSPLVEADTTCTPALAFRYDAGMTEWWTSRMGALEQGWTVEAAPAGEGALRFVIALDGAAEIEGTPWGARIRGEDDGRWSVGSLAARDATGRGLPTHLEVEGDSIVVAVEDDGATYPITVDPSWYGTTWTYQAYMHGIAGDLNGDGWQDAFGHSYYTAGPRVYITYGSAAGFASSPDVTLALTSYDASLTAVLSAHGAGDVNGDGYDDLIVGTLRSGNTGRALVYYGSAAGIATTPGWTVLDSTGRGGLGVVNRAGDVNGDGYDDVIAAFRSSGSPPSETTGTYLYHGSAAGLSTSPAVEIVESQRSGNGIAFSGAIGDVNGDGYDDVGYCSAFYGVTQAGIMEIRYGSPTGVSAAANLLIPGSDPNAYLCQNLGAAVGNIDVNGDGYGDLAIGAYGTQTVQVHYGSATGLSSSPNVTLSGAANFGRNVGDACDANDDGIDDLIAADWGGTLALYLGGTGGLSSVAADSAAGPGAWLYELSCLQADSADVFEDLLGGVMGYGYSLQGACTGACLSVTCYTDVDGDGYATTATITAADGDCTDPGEADASAPRTDCDDTDATINPAGVETTGDGMDSNCDGDEVCFLDGDADGYSAGSTVVSTSLDCSASGVLNAAGPFGDCDDADGASYPGAPETLNDGIDQDCDGSDSTVVDADHDGSPATLDCNDLNAAVYPGRPETCNGVDDDCDGQADEGVKAVSFADTDGDGYGNKFARQFSCGIPSGSASRPGDCNDASASQRPGQAEVCDGIDNDCDGVVDEVGRTGTCPASTGSGRDLDGDGWRWNVDCNDTNAAIHPGAVEVCDGADNDCDGRSDEGLTMFVFPDGDGDGYGKLAGRIMACAPPAGFVTNPADCDDSHSTRHPGLGDACDGLDNDCDGTLDDGGVCL